MRLAYADPPYLGCAKRLYGDATYDKLAAHVALIERLVTYDGWAYSCHVRGLKEIMPYLPKRARIGAWVKPFAFFKPGIWPAYAWEPVVFIPARGPTREQPTRFDWVQVRPVGVTKEERLIGTKGSKPPEFCDWVFDILRAEPGDEFDDMFLGSGRVTTAWNKRFVA